MTAKDAPKRSKGTHTLIGVGAAMLGVVLGIGVVYWDRANDKQQLAVYAEGSGSCQQEETACMSKPGGSHGSCHPKWVQCMQKCMVGGTGAGQCNQDPECQASCTESATSQGGKISCCEGGPQHGNACKDKVDGKCNPKQTELGKDMPMPKEMPKGDEKGGGAPMLPMPKGGEPKPPEQPKDEECQKEPKPANCENGVSNSLFDNFKNLFTGDTSGSENADEAPSVADRLKSFFGMDATNDSSAASAVNNPTEAVVTPVTSGSNVGGLNASGGTQGGTNTGNQGSGSGAGFTTVTGFNSNASGEQDTGISSGMRDAISQTLNWGKVIVRNILNWF